MIINIRCKDCGSMFAFTEFDQKFYEENNYDFPSRCKKCRVEKRERNRISTPEAAIGIWIRRMFSLSESDDSFTNESIMIVKIDAEGIHYIRTYGGIIRLMDPKYWADGHWKKSTHN